tara:strand:- start:233 stop:3757 length:3525 start_codon:yes stop_codon:yes gene_type:complete
MSLTGLLNLLSEDASFSGALSEGGTPSSRRVVEVRDGAKAAFISALASNSNATIIVVTAEEPRAAELANDIAVWARNTTVLHFPDVDVPPYSLLAISHDLLAQRISVLGHLQQQLPPTSPGPLIVTTSVRAAMRHLMPLKEFLAHSLSLSPGNRSDLNEVTRKLIALGYQSTHLVEHPGEFAHRGGIIDIFAPHERWPVRVDFLGSELESIRKFDPKTQRSFGASHPLLLTPATEFPTWLGPGLGIRLDEMDLEELRAEDKGVWKRHHEQLHNSEHFDDAAFYSMSLLADTAALFDYAPTSLLVIDEVDHVAATARDTEKSAQTNRERLVSGGQLPPAFPSPLFSSTHILSLLEKSQLHLTYAPKLPTTAELPRSIVSGFEAQKPYGGRLQHMADDLLKLQNENNRIVIVSHQGERLQRLLEEQGVTSTLTKEIVETPDPKSISVLKGNLAEGWRHPHSKIALITDSELFGRKTLRRLRAGSSSTDRTFLADLETGDYVVHVEHGIGKFQGIVQMSESSGQREYLALEYMGTDRLYIPVDQIGRIQKYVGMSDREPKLNRLGTADWTKAKQKAQRSAEEIAAGLLEIYAARETSTGHAFEEDSPWQGEFEDKFPFIETPDQLRAITDVKGDMERARPMDRLIAGDVGYGKTEVALRATFKAAMSGKQVAILVPTTVLAQQHYDTFVSRMRDFPLKIAQLSRFRKRSEQEATICGLASGDINIVIGTHRVLQKDVVFEDLGLIVIDEEQRFGVQQKEQLKALRHNVDVVTLTATPIPRTLHMALSGLREISVIESPPERRLAVKTYVSIYHDEIVSNAIRNEIDRGGQVYFLHNRIQTINTWAERLKALLPSVNILVGHGQMSSNELEDVMYRFARGDAQVLLSTAIIENGLDIPNVNTIIINDAWRFGLAQLYQLRGRVGRSEAQAYAYFLYQKDQKLTEEAEKRLQTILEASELGAGFRIAMRDLEIRGAGNLLGADQHGHVTTIGFDLYTRMLRVAVQELQGTHVEAEESSPVVVDLPLDAYLPDEYMGSYGAKVREYQRLASLRTISSVEEAIADIRDRFGELPEPVANMATILRVKVRAIELGIQSITTYDRELLIKLPPGRRVNSALIAKAVGRQMRQGQHGLSWKGFEGSPEWPKQLLTLLDSVLRWDRPRRPEEQPVATGSGDIPRQ